MANVRLGLGIPPQDVWSRLVLHADEYIDKYIADLTGWRVVGTIERDSDEHFVMTLTLVHKAKRPLVFRYTATHHRMFFTTPHRQPSSRIKERPVAQ